MGYVTRLHLLDVRIKEDCLEKVRKKIEGHVNEKNDTLQFFLESIVITSGGFLAFKATGDDAYSPDDEGTVPTLDAKWHDDEKIAKWLRQVCEAGGMIVQHSLEADGVAYGWEFNGKGKMRKLQMMTTAKWS
jgi:hypothetical protein